MDSTNTDIILVQHSVYGGKQFEQTIDTLLSSHLEGRSFYSSRVLLKPNLISPANNGLACTEPVVIAAAAKWFIDRGAIVSVGDSPAFGSAEAALDKIGATGLMRKLGVEIREFTRVDQVRLPNGKTAGVAAVARECDFLVNIARVKAHSQARVTMAVKNLFGCVVGMRKPWWHMVHGAKSGCFSDLLVQLPWVLPEGISLTDGIIGMHTTGPIHGFPVRLGLLGSGPNPVALDTAFLEVLGVDPADCPLGSAAVRAGIPGARGKDLSWQGGKGLQPENEFGVPHNLAPIRFNPFRFVKNTIRRLVS